MKFYVYEHWRPDVDVCFYVGKGSGSRSHCFSRKRNRHYDGIVKKLTALGMCIEVRMVASGLSEDAAYDLEKNRIEFWLECGFTLANKAVGGRGGMSGVKRSLESRAKQSATMIGRKLSSEHRAKIIAEMNSPGRREANSKVHTGRKRPDETRAKISAGNKAVYADPARGGRRRASVSLANKGREVSEKTRAKMREAKTKEARALISAAAKKQWNNPEFRKLVSDTMKRTNARRRNAQCAE